jgi:glycerophosphoryl diester phosphodiesterase
MQIFGHRGAPGFPRRAENTIGSFQLALDAGADGFELDVRRCASGELVVIHDATIDRTTNGNGMVSSMRYSQLRTFDAGNGEPLPLLTHVLDTFANRCTIYVELKEAGLAPAVVQIVRERRLEDFVVLITFDADDAAAGGPAWEELRTVESPIGTGILATPSKLHRIGLENYISTAKTLRASLQIAKEAVDERFVDAAHRAGLTVRVFTVNQPEEFRRLRGLGVDAIFTDFPREARLW